MLVWSRCSLEVAERLFEGPAQPRRTWRRVERPSRAAGASRQTPATSHARGRAFAALPRHRPPPKTAQGARRRPQLARPPGSRTVKPRFGGLLNPRSPPRSLSTARHVSKPIKNVWVLLAAAKRKTGSARALEAPSRNGAPTKRSLPLRRVSQVYDPGPAPAAFP